MTDLIDRWKLLSEIKQLKQGWRPADYVLDKVVELVKAQPTADVKAENFMDCRAAARDKEAKRREAAISLYDIIEHTESGLLEED